MSVFSLWPRRIGAAALMCAGSWFAAAPAASAAPVVPHPFTITQFAAGSPALSNPDDIVRLGSDLFVGWQNGVGAMGEPGPNGTTSTVVEYDASGNTVNEWAPTGRVDGLAADPRRHLVYATVNEDGHSSFYVIDPHAPQSRQLSHLTYNDPNGVMTGGSDAISVDRRGNVYISMSNPSAAGASAVALARVDSPRGEVTLAPTFADDASGVQNGNDPGSSTTLALTDPDSNALVPRSSPRFAGDFMLDSQGDGKLVFAPDGFDSSTPPSELTQLSLNVPGSTGQPVVDDVRWATRDDGALYVVDQGAGVIYTITGPFQAGQAFASQPTDPSNPPLQSDVVSVDLAHGAESPFATGFVSPKGLLYVSDERRATARTDRRDR